MKELKKKESDKIENVRQVSVEKKTVFLGTAHPKKGHTMFEVNHKLKTIEVAEFDISKTLEYHDVKRGIKKAPKSITKKPDCIYVSALNKKNALRFLKREIGFDINAKD